MAVLECPSWALIVPMLVNPWWVFVLRNFFNSLPEELIDSARILVMSTPASAQQPIP